MMESTYHLASKKAEGSSRGGNLYEHVRKLRERDGHTPLSLAAKLGSRHMFHHLMGKQMTLEWVFGPVTCRKLYLDDIDVPLDSEVERRRLAATGGLRRSVLEVVVEGGRLDILAEGTVMKILDAKWHKYARVMFQSKFWWAVAFTIILMASSVFDPGQGRLEVGILLTLDAFLVALCFQQWLKEMVKLRKTHTLKLSIGHALDSFEVAYGMLAFPICLTLFALHAYRCSFLLTGAAPREGWWHNLGDEGGWLGRAEAFGLSMLSYMSFCNIFYGMMGFPEYGNFILMLIQMLRHDVRIFLVIYSVFFFGFSHIHYVSVPSAKMVGTKQFMLSMENIFRAVLQQVNLDTEHWIDHGIGLLNFFLVSLVLTNLLIAMLSSTFQDIALEAKRRWQHLRASIILKIDKAMTDEERSDKINIFWQPERVNDVSMRFMTFTTGENRDQYLGIENKANSTADDE